MATTTQLTIYNNALLEMGESPIASLSESSLKRRVLDAVWDSQDGDIRNYWLQQGLWNFAARTIELPYESSLTVPFGWDYGFVKPTDHIRTMKFCSDEHLKIPITQMDEDSGYWFCNYDTVYIQYVSNDTEYGLDYSLWPPSFLDYVHKWMAEKACMAITKSKSMRKDLIDLSERALRKAKSLDAMESPTTFPTTGSWLNARSRSRTNNEPKSTRYS